MRTMFSLLRLVRASEAMSAIADRLKVTKEKGFEILNEVDLKAVIDTVAA